jgi:hypothetical protein
MSIRWSISNRLLAISFEQFQAMSREFIAVVEPAFAGRCKVEVKAMDRISETCTFYLDDRVMEYIARRNERYTFFRTDDLAAVTAQIFRSAAYIELIIRPLDADSALSNACAHAEFKGLRPKQATFNVRPETEIGLQRIRANHRFQVFGDGFPGNWRL